MNIQELFNKTISGDISKEKFFDDLFLHTTSADSNGKKLPVYNEN